MRYFPSLTSFVLLSISNIKIEGTRPAYNGARTPPRGWNSWDSSLTWATEIDVIENARIAVDTGMAGTPGINISNYFVTIDMDWAKFYNNTDNYFGYNMDEYGRFLPSPERFTNESFLFMCSSIMSFAPNVRCGAHIVYGIPILAVNKTTPILGAPGYTAADIFNKSGITGGCCYYFNSTHPATPYYISSYIDLLVSQGITFFKLDFLPEPSFDPLVVIDITHYRAAMDVAGDKYNVEVVLSINGGLYDSQQLYEAGIAMKRITPDTWDTYDMLIAHTIESGVVMSGNNTAYSNTYEISGGGGFPGFWPDLDMLPVGQIGGKLTPTTPYPVNGSDCTLTQLGCGNPNAAASYPCCCPRQSRYTIDETYSLLGLWSITRSPMIMGGDLRETEGWLMDALSNPEIIMVNQQAVTGSQLQLGDAPITRNQTVVWVSQPSATVMHDVRMMGTILPTVGSGNGTVIRSTANTTAAIWLYVYNTADYPQQSSPIDLDALFLLYGQTSSRMENSSQYAVRDLWKRMNLGNTGSSYQPPLLQAHASILYSIVLTSF